VLLSGIMASAAKKLLLERILFDVICETYSCLPDAVQILTAWFKKEPNIKNPAQNFDRTICHSFLYLFGLN
jgi:hypothetical protein